jgi:uncharacterized membrane protein
MSGGRRSFLRSLTTLLVVAALLRLLGVVLADRMVADVLRYHKIASHVLDVSWNPYEAARLYPYPPAWILFEVAAEWLSRLFGGGFAVLVKLPAVAADVAIVWLLAKVGLARGLGAEGSTFAAAWVYALHPVALLVVGFHGQFDSLAVLAVLLALVLNDSGRRDASALVLALGIATKSFPVLLVPFFLLVQPGFRRGLRYLALATLPVAASLVPFAVANWSALLRELFGYGGVADFGWIGLVRSVEWLVTGHLPRSEAAHWPRAVATGKVVFLVVWLGLLVLFAWRRRRVPLADACLAVLLAFLGLYGAVSAQYLLWVVPLGLLRLDRHSFSFGVAATLALLGFYPFLAPGVLFPAAGNASSSGFGVVWCVGLALLLAATLVWLATLVSRLVVRSET